MSKASFSPHGTGRAAAALPSYQYELEKKRQGSASLASGTASTRRKAAMSDATVRTDDGKGETAA